MAPTDARRRGRRRRVDRARGAAAVIFGVRRQNLWNFLAGTADGPASHQLWSVRGELWRERVFDVGDCTRHVDDVSILLLRYDVQSQLLGGTESHKLVTEVGVGPQLIPRHFLSRFHRCPPSVLLAQTAELTICSKVEHDSWGFCRLWLRNDRAHAFQLSHVQNVTGSFGKELRLQRIVSVGWVLKLEELKLGTLARGLHEPEHGIHRARHVVVGGLGLGC
mmetsp:Transcript_43266/g.63487  ORF Transcript_43266/g.63487 Transcript_43266/m.63487 type:complete len:221 (+) Transcript_43266:645-1307(+)